MIVVLVLFIYAAMPVIGSQPVLQVESAPAPRTVEVAGHIDGTATWYCGNGSPCTRGYGPSDLVAAIDPTTGIGKGAVVTVSHAGRSVTVRIVDVCLCRDRRVIDLTSGAFKRLAPLSVGVIDVTLSTAGPSVTPPATDVTP